MVLEKVHGTLVFCNLGPVVLLSIFFSQSFFLWIATMDTKDASNRMASEASRSEASRSEASSSEASRIVKSIAKSPLDGLHADKWGRSLTGCRNSDLMVCQYLIDKEIARFAGSSVGMYRAVRTIRNFVLNVTCLLVDNTTSMQWKDSTWSPRNYALQRSFGLELLNGLHDQARVAVRLLMADDKHPLMCERFAPLVQGCAAVLARPLFDTLLSLPVDEFCTAGTTLLFQSLLDTVGAGFHAVVVLTDGEDTGDKEEGFASFQLNGQPLSMSVDAFNSRFILPTQPAKDEKPVKKPKKNKLLVTWNAKKPLTSFMKALHVSLPEGKVFMPTIIGLGMTPESSMGLLPVHSINDVRQVKRLAQRVRLDTVPREAGGGVGSQPQAVLRYERSTAVAEGARHFMRTDWKTLPNPAKSKHCVALLVSQRMKTGGLTSGLTSGLAAAGPTAMDLSAVPALGPASVEKKDGGAGALSPADVKKKESKQKSTWDIPPAGERKVIWVWLYSCCQQYVYSRVDGHSPTWVSTKHWLFKSCLRRTHGHWLSSTAMASRPWTNSSTRLQSTT
jgi:hypothetical protein